MNIIFLIIVCAVIISTMIGVLISYIFITFLFRKKTAGCLIIDESDPNENPYFFLELGKDVDYLYNKKYIILRLKKKNFVTQK